jgi:hypothetical protein
LLTATAGLAQLRSHYTPETKELFGVLLNAASSAEANLALDVLRESLPEKSLVTACNLREVIRSLPASPFSMRVDEPILTRTAGLTVDVAVRSKTLPDGIELAVTTAGNLVLDVIVKAEGHKYYLTPIPMGCEFVHPGVVDLIMRSEILIDALVDLVRCMGIVFNPKFYLSLEDFWLEYAADMMHELDDVF